MSLSNSRGCLPIDQKCRGNGGITVQGNVGSHGFMDAARQANAVYSVFDQQGWNWGQHRALAVGVNGAGSLEGSGVRSCYSSMPLYVIVISYDADQRTVTSRDLNSA